MTVKPRPEGEAANWEALRALPSSSAEEVGTRKGGEDTDGKVCPGGGPEEKLGRVVGSDMQLPEP